MSNALIHLALTVDGQPVTGDSEEVGVEGLIRVDHIRWSVAAASLPFTGAPVGRSGHATFQSHATAVRLGQLHVHKSWDRASAQLLRACAQGARADSVRLIMSSWAAHAEGQHLRPLLELTLRDLALVELRSWTDSSGAASGERRLRERLVLGGPRDMHCRYHPPAEDSPFPWSPDRASGSGRGAGAAGETGAAGAEQSVMFSASEGWFDSVAAHAQVHGDRP